MVIKFFLLAFFFLNIKSVPGLASRYSSHCQSRRRSTICNSNLLFRLFLFFTIYFTFKNVIYLFIKGVEFTNMPREDGKSRWLHFRRIWPFNFHPTRFKVGETLIYIGQFLIRWLVVQWLCSMFFIGVFLPFPMKQNLCFFRLTSNLSTFSPNWSLWFLRLFVFNVWKIVFTNFYLYALKKFF